VLAGARVSEPVAGTAEGITDGGALRIRTDTGPVREVLAGVVMVPT
jgi:biotin-(acetyl-CoA carboxylase) ligase